MAYIRAAQNGNFSSPSTWVGGVVPAAGDYACTLTNRITLDVSTDAHLCVNQTDWVAAGGTATASFTGGFTVPTGATITVGGSFRYDGSGSPTTTNSNINMTTGSLTINGGVIYVAGYYQPSTTTIYIICLTPATVNSVSLIINNRLEYPRASTALAALYYARLIYCTGYTNGQLNLTFPDIVSVGTATNYQMTILTVTGGSTGFNIVYNGTFSTACNLSPTQAMDIDISASSTLNNQNVTINATSLGSNGVAGVYPALTVTALDNLTFTQPLTVDNVYQQDLIRVSNLKSGGTVRALGDITCTATTQGFLRVTTGASNASVILQGLSFSLSSTNYNCPTLITVDGSGAFTCNDISVSSNYAQSSSIPLIALANTGNISVGNMLYVDTCYTLRHLMLISGTRVGTTTLHSIDASNVSVSTTTDINVVIISNALQSACNIIGDIKGANKGGTVNTVGSALYFSNTASNNMAVTITGNVYAGSRLGALRIIDNASYPFTIVGNAVSPTYDASLLQYPYAIRSNSCVVGLQGIVHNSSLALPVSGRCTLPSSGLVKIYDASNTQYTYTAQPLGAMPVAADVRKGVAIGTTVGTLNVPPVSFVLKDISVDNTTGTLDVFGEVSNLMAKLQNGGVSARSLDPQWNAVTLSVQVDDDLNIVPIKTIVGFELLKVAYEPSVSVYARIYGTKTVTFRGRPTIRLNGGYIHTTNPGTLQPMSGSGNWTVDLAFRLDALPASGNVLMLFQYQSYMNVEVSTTGEIGIWFSSYSDNSYHATTGLNLQPNAFYTLAMQRSGNYISLYINGARVLYFMLNNALSSLFGYGTTMTIGHDTGVSSRSFIGYMQDITVTDGIARYSGTSYTPAAATYPHNGALAPLSTSTISEQLYSLFATTSEVNAKTTQLTFTANGVVADAGSTGGGSGGASTDYTARFNTLDTSVAAVNTAVAAVKAKTDQLAFTGGTVNANASSTDYSARFDSLDNAILNLSLTDYTATLGRIETKVDNIAVPTNDLTTIQNALTSISSAVGNVYGKVSDLTYTANGVVADVTVSVQQVIDYAARFDAIDSDLDTIKLKVNPLTYGANGVMATANVDIQPLSTTLSSGLSSLLTSVNPRFNAIDTKLVEIGNATGAIDLTPITEALDDIYASVQSVPRLDYTATFVGVVNKLNLIQGKTDTIPALATAVASIPTVTYSTVLSNLTAAVAAIPTTNYSSALSSLTAKVDAIPTTEYTTVLAGIADTTNTTYDKVNSLTGCDLNPVLTALAALDARFNQASSGALAVIPQASADKTTVYGYCRTTSGDPIPDAMVSIRIQQASGVGSLYAASALTATSDAEGRVVFTIPRDPTIVIVVSLGSKVERFKCNGEAIQAMPSIVGDVQSSGGGNAV